MEEEKTPKCEQCKKVDVPNKGERCRKCMDDDSPYKSPDLSGFATAAAAGCFG